MINSHFLPIRLSLMLIVLVSTLSRCLIIYDALLLNCGPVQGPGKPTTNCRDYGFARFRCWVQVHESESLHLCLSLTIGVWNLEHSSDGRGSKFMDPLKLSANQLPTRHYSSILLNNHLYTSSMDHQKICFHYFIHHSNPGKHFRFAIRRETR